jgi:hypothetical protein
MLAQSGRPICAFLRQRAALPCNSDPPSCDSDITCRRTAIDITCRRTALDITCRRTAIDITCRRTAIDITVTFTCQTGCTPPSQKSCTHRWLSASSYSTFYSVGTETSTSKQVAFFSQKLLSFLYCDMVFLHRLQQNGTHYTALCGS